MLEGVVRFLAVLTGCAMIGTAAHVSVLASGGYGADHALLIVAVAAGLCLGSIVYGFAVAWDRVGASRVMLVAMIAGEVVGLITTGERIVGKRVADRQPAAQIESQRSVANDAVKAAEAAVEREIARGDRKKKEGCDAICRKDVKADLALAHKRLDDARTALAKTPATVSGAGPTDRAWMNTLDLTVAALLSIAVNGLGASLLALGAHGRKHRPEAVAVPIAAPVVAEPIRLRPTATSKSMSVAVSTKARDVAAEADQFAASVFRPHRTARVPAADVGIAYRSWCEERGLEPLDTQVLGDALVALFAAHGVTVSDEFEVVGLRLLPKYRNAA